MTNQNIKEIKKLNDLLRTTFLTGKVVLTEGFRDLEDKTKEELITKIREFKEFHANNDPYGEHDFGSVEHDEIKVYWKIDYYDRNFKYLSPNPADSKLTCRVLTIMLAEEY